MAHAPGKRPVAALSALLLALAGSVVAGEEIPGRLFFTPEQRAQLDAARARGEPPPPPPAPVATTPEKAAPPPPDRITIDGMVRSTDGRTVVWVNKQRRNPAVTPTPVPGDASRVRVDLGQDLGSAELRVGQRFDRITGRIEEPYRLAPAAPPAPPATVPATPAETPAQPPAPQPAAAARRGPDEEPPPVAAEEGAAAPAAVPVPMTRRRY